MYAARIRGSLCIAAIFAAAGCSGVGSTAASPPGAPAGAVVHAGTPVAAFYSSHSRLPFRSVGSAYKTKGSLVFEGDQAETAVNVYQTSALSKNPSPIASIKVQTGCPYGLAMDKKGTLYVADNCVVGDVEEYPKGSTTESVAITDGISYPLGLAIDSKGTLYVSNYPGAITEYAYGTTSPSQTITGQGITDPFGLAVDKQNNLYIADFGASQVFEIKYGTTTVTPLNLQDITEPICVAIDKKTGDMWVTDGAGNKIDVYKAGQTTPFEQIAGNGNPYAISIENQGKPKGTVVASDVASKAVYAYKKGQYTSYATLTNGIQLPTGLLIAKP